MTRITLSPLSGWHVKTGHMGRKVWITDYSLPAKNKPAALFLALAIKLCVREK